MAPKKEIRQAEKVPFSARSGIRAPSETSIRVFFTSATWR